jgi:hypothetical protein
VMQVVYSCCAFMTECNTLPRLHEQPPGALSGAGQNGIGSVAAGHWTKYSSINSSYSQEYTYRTYEQESTKVVAQATYLIPARLGHAIDVGLVHGTSAPENTDLASIADVHAPLAGRCSLCYATGKARGVCADIGSNVSLCKSKINGP